MAVGKFLFMCGLVFLIGEVQLEHAFHCPSYEKHVAIREGLLDNQTICRTRFLPYNIQICLNGFAPDWLYCSTAGCNIFGFNCDGHCLSGNDYVYKENYKGLSCDINLEIQRLCDFYLQYEKTVVFYSTKLQKLCLNLLFKCKKAIDKEWKYE